MVDQKNNKLKLVIWVNWEDFVIVAVFDSPSTKGRGGLRRGHGSPILGTGFSEGSLIEFPRGVVLLLQ